LEFDALSSRVSSSALKVHKELGPGFLESIYHSALLVQLRRDGMKADTQKEIHIKYAGVEVGLHRLDLVVDDTIVIELKATRDFNDTHMAQIISYLKASGLKVGLLLNFGRSTLKVKRAVL
jgi:GxxExxY protein